MRKLPAIPDDNVANHADLMPLCARLYAELEDGMRNDMLADRIFTRQMSLIDEARKAL